jgi:porin
MKGPVRPSLATVLAAAALASAIAHAGRAAADDTEPEITSWMLPPSTRPVWGLLQIDRVRGSGPPLETVDSLTGNWRGYRDRLRDENGLAVVGNYTSESAGNPVGGNRQGVTYTHNVDLAVFADLSKLVGLNDAAFLVSASNRAGSSLSAQYIGNVYAVQQIFGGETTRLVQLAVGKALFRRRLRIVAGRINGLDDFIASPLYCNAQNLAFCGNPLSIPSDVNISSYPNTMWGARVRWEPSPLWYAMGGVYNAVAGFRANRFHGVDFSIRHNSGAIGIGEVGVRPEHIGPGGLFTSLPGNYKLGGYWDTEPLTNFETGRRERGTGGFYVAGDQMLWQEANATTGQGLYLWTAFHWAPSDMNPQDRFVSCGLVYPGLVPGRDADVAGLYGAYGHFSADQRAAQRRAGQPGQVYEAVLELNYRIALLPWFYVQPDIQGIINPGAAHQFGDALVFAVQFGVPF